MSDQKRCPTCGEEYPLSERFCPRDGSVLRRASTVGDLVGTIVAERYHVLRLLGEGGMGRVYLAEHVKMGRKAALKVLTPGLHEDAAAVARFNREAANASRLNHPNICAVYDFGETPEGTIYLAMEFVDGETLTSLIQIEGALPPARAAGIVEQVAEALGAAHDAGIVHRDLKPDNVMVARGRENTDVVKVVDFGIAKSNSSETRRLTMPGYVMGTPDYMSPEQVHGAAVDGRSDIYSLGIVAFNCLTGKLPFTSQSTHDAMMMRLSQPPARLALLKPDTIWPPELEAVLDKALAGPVAKRYQQAVEFGRDFSKAVENVRPITFAAADTQQISAPVAGGAGAPLPPTRVARAADRRLVPTIAAAAAVVIATGGGLWAMFGGGHGAKPSPVAQGDGTGRASGTIAGRGETAPSGRRDTAPVGRVNGTPARPADGKGPPKALSQPIAKLPDSPRTATAVTTHRVQLDELEGLVDGVTADKAQVAVDRVTALLPSLSGAEKGEALWRLGEARFTLKQRTLACEALDQARQLLRGTKLSPGVDAYFDKDNNGLCLSPLSSEFA